jgi:hypothetical protein
MNQVIEYFKGKKAYLVGTLAVILAVGVHFQVLTPEDVKQILSDAQKYMETLASLNLGVFGLGIIALRAAISKIGSGKDQ